MSVTNCFNFLCSSFSVHDVQEEMEMVGVELKRRETDNSGIIAGTSSSLRPSSRTAHESSAETKGQSQRAGNVVLTSLSYKYAEPTVSPTHTLSLSLPQTINK